MLTTGRFVGFIPTTDVARARTFYETVLGLTVTEESSFALILDANGTTLRVTAGEEYQPHPFTIAGWGVDDLATEIDDLRSRGVEFNRYNGMEQDEHGIWTSPSTAQIAWFTDPDGNVLSLTQF